jgi:hypothetical protein
MSGRFGEHLQSAILRRVFIDSVGWNIGEVESLVGSPGGAFGEFEAILN